MREGGCSGPSRDYLESLCMMLPDEKCLPAVVGELGCSENEFQCGDGKCVSSLAVCNREVDCCDASDEVGW